MSPWRFFVRGCAGAILAAGAACTTLPAEQPAAVPAEKPAPAAAKPVAPAPAPKPKPVVSAPKEAEPAPVPAPTARPLEELRRGVQRYDDGQYKEAARSFQAAIDLGLASPADQVTAHKHLAFIACVGRRNIACRSEFRKAFEADPAFDLSAAEAGHPMWGPVFRSVKAELAKKRKPAAVAKPAPPPAR